MKTLAIRLDDDVHARLVILAKLADVSRLFADEGVEVAGASVAG